MEVKIVRFSRPLLIRTSWYMDDYQYQTIYGFWLPEHVEPKDPIGQMRLEQYIGYLCGLHCWSSGDGFFTIKDGRWTDETGISHTKQERADNEDYRYRSRKKYMKCGIELQILESFIRDDKCCEYKNISKYTILIIAFEEEVKEVIRRSHISCC